MRIIHHIRDVSDLVEHVATGEQQNKDQGDGGPEVLGIECGLESTKCKLQDDEGDDDCASHHRDLAVVDGTGNTDVTIDTAAYPMRNSFGRDITSKISV